MPVLLLSKQKCIEAISVLDEHAEEIALLLTDVRMPGTIDGITLGENCRKNLAVDMRNYHLRQSGTRS
jgi:CheY-like chemotaxis protein